jgi:hypothetical protein
MQRAAIVLVLLLIVAAIVAGLYGLCGSSSSALQCVRDVAIIVLVLETFVVTLLLALIVLLFGRLISTIQDQVMPVLHSAQRTAQTVEGTTKFVSDTVVAPLISLAGFAAGLRGTVAALLMRGRKKAE